MPTNPTGKESTDLLEKRLEILIIVINAVIIGVSVNMISNSLSGQVPLYYLPISLSVILFSILWISNHFLGKLVIDSISMILLLNKDSGEVLPLTYRPASVASFALSSLQKIKPEIWNMLSKGLLGRDNPLIRDLIEYIVINWLSITSSIEMDPQGRVLLPPILPPGSSVKSLDVLSILHKFGDNVFTQTFKERESSPIVKIPQSIDVVAKRYKSKDITIGMSVGDMPIFTRIISGEPGGSETILKGSCNTPLDFLSIRFWVNRVSLGHYMYLVLSGYTPLSLFEDKIICKEKIIEGKELEYCRKWIEIECTIVVAYKLRGWLFWHPQFEKWYNWCEAMQNHAKQYFDISPILRHMSQA